MEQKSACPSCGYCPHCGRFPQPLMPAPYQPTTAPYSPYSPNAYPPIVWGGITAGNLTGGLVGLQAHLQNIQ